MLDSIFDFKFDVDDFSQLKKFLEIDYWKDKNPSDIEILRSIIASTASKRTDAEIAELKSQGVIFEEAHGMNRAALKKEYKSNTTLMKKDEHDAYHSLEFIGALLTGDKEKLNDSRNRAATFVDAYGHFKYTTEEEYIAIKQSKELIKERNKIEKQIQEAQNKVFFVCLGSSSKDRASFISTAELSRLAGDDFVKSVRNQGKDTWRGDTSPIDFCTIAYAAKNEPSRYKRLARLEEETESKEEDSTSSKTTSKGPSSKTLINILREEGKNLALFNEKGEFIGKGLTREIISDLIANDMKSRGYESVSTEFKRPICDAVKCINGGQMSIATKTGGTVAYQVFYEDLNVKSSKYTKQYFTSVFATIPISLKALIK